MHATSRRTTRLDWGVAATSSWMVGGIWLDAWAHHVITLETFFTPWHAVLYSGMAGVAAILVASGVRGGRPSLGWYAALPRAYRLSLIGVALFAVGGAADAVWHTLLGVEVDLEALVSPPHLLLGTGGLLIVSGPMRAAWTADGRSRSLHWPDALPPLLSLALTISVLAFFTTFANPFSLPLAAAHPPPALVTDVAATDLRGALGQSLGIASVLVQSGLVVGGRVLALRRWVPPIGAFTLVLSVGLGLSTLPHELYGLLPAAFATGMAADALTVWLRQSLGRARTTHLLSLLIPALATAFYFASLSIVYGLAWTLPLISGSIVLAGGVGLLLSLVVQAAAPADR